MRSGSISYARIASRYEAVRGGDGRADELASAIRPWLPDTGLVCDIGAGTGVVSERLVAPGRDVCAFDLSIEMVSQAASRLPGRIAVADAERIPVADGSVDAVTFVWVLHHVGNLERALREAHRMLRPGGVVVSISGMSNPAQDDMAPIFERLSDALRPERRAQSMAVAEVAEAVGFSVIREGLVPTTATASPDELVESIEQRMFSHLWDLSDEDWHAHVDPAIEALRALPDPAVARTRTFEHPLVVLSR